MSGQIKMENIPPDQTDFVLNIPNWLQILLIKFHGSNWSDRHVCLGLVRVLPRERVWRNSETYSYDCVDLSHHLLCRGHQLRLTRASINGLTEVLGIFSQLALEDTIETAGGLARICFWKTFLGHEPVLGDEVDHHVPLASVIDGIIEDASNSSTGDILSSLRCQD